jgi:hypothetical protein
MSKTEHGDAVKPMTPEIAAKLAAAFAAIWECEDYLPFQVLENLQDELRELVDWSDWIYKPELFQKVFPMIAPHIDWSRMPEREVTEGDGIKVTCYKEAHHAKG